MSDFRKDLSGPLIEQRLGLSNPAYRNQGGVALARHILGFDTAQ